MKSIRLRTVSLLALVSSIGAASALAGETVVFTYDAKGNLIRAERSGTARGSELADYSYDPAGNRGRARTVNGAAQSYATLPATVRPMGTPVPTPSPTPTPAPNNPPEANNDSGNTSVGNVVSVNVLANDTDPDGDYPLTVIAVGTPTLGAGASFNSPFVTVGGSCTPGTSSVTYTVRDSRGATSTGTLVVVIANGNGCM